MIKKLFKILTISQLAFQTYSFYKAYKQNQKIEELKIRLDKNY